MTDAYLEAVRKIVGLRAEEAQWLDAWAVAKGLAMEEAMLDQFLVARRRRESAEQAAHRLWMEMAGPQKGVDRRTA